MSTFRRTTPARIRAMQAQAKRLDRMGFRDTANLLKGMAWMDQAITPPSLPQVQRTAPFIGVVKGGRHDL